MKWVWSIFGFVGKSKAWNFTSYSIFEPQCSFRIFLILWVERKDKDNFQTQGNPKIPEKRSIDSTEDEAEDYEDKMKFYEVYSKVWDFLIISLTDIPFGLVRQCDKNAHEYWKALIDKYEVSDEKQDILN